MSMFWFIPLAILTFVGLVALCVWIAVLVTENLRPNLFIAFVLVFGSVGFSVFVLHNLPHWAGVCGKGVECRSEHQRIDDLELRLNREGK